MYFSSVSVHSAERIESSSWKPAHQPGWRKASCAGHLYILKVVQNYYLKHGIRLDIIQRKGRMQIFIQWVEEYLFYFQHFNCLKFIFPVTHLSQYYQLRCNDVYLFIYLSTVVQRETQAYRHLYCLAFVAIWYGEQLNWFKGSKYNSVSVHQCPSSSHFKLLFVDKELFNCG